MIWIIVCRNHRFLVKSRLVHICSYSLYNVYRSARAKYRGILTTTGWTKEAISRAGRFAKLSAGKTVHVLVLNNFTSLPSRRLTVYATVALFSLRGTYDFVKPSDPRRPKRESKVQLNVHISCLRIEATSKHLQNIYVFHCK